MHHYFEQKINESIDALIGNESIRDRMRIVASKLLMLKVHEGVVPHEISELFFQVITSLDDVDLLSDDECRAVSGKLLKIYDYVVRNSENYE